MEAVQLDPREPETSGLHLFPKISTRTREEKHETGRLSVVLSSGFGTLGIWELYVSRKRNLPR